MDTNKRRNLPLIRSLLALLPLALVVTVSPHAAAQDEVESNQTGTISGAVTVPAGHSPQAISVFITDAAHPDTHVASASPTEDGEWSVEGIPAGDYLIEFSSSDEHIEGLWWPNASDPTGAEKVPLVAGEDVDVIEVALPLRDRGEEIAHLEQQPQSAPAESDVGGSIAGQASEANPGAQHDDGLDYSQSAPDATGSAVSQESESVTLPKPGGEHRRGILPQTSPRSAPTSKLGGTASISGKVTVPAGETPNRITVVARTNESWEEYEVKPAADGTYKIPNLPAGLYTVEFHSTKNTMVSQWWKAKTSFDSATWIRLSDGEERTGIDAKIAVGASISGKITVPKGHSVYDVAVYVHTGVEDRMLADVSSDGTFKVGGLRPGTYRIRFESYDSVLASQWWKGKGNYYTATKVTLKAGQSRTGISVTMTKGGSISGTISALPGTDLRDVYVSIFDLGGEFITSAGVTKSGSYKATGLSSGQYKVKYTVFGEGSKEAPAWWKGKNDFPSATRVSVTLGKNTSLGKTALTKGATLKGKVVVPAGKDPGDLMVTIYDLKNEPIATTTPKTNGAYTFSGLAAGKIKVEFYDLRQHGSVMATQWWKGKSSFAAATTLELKKGETRKLADVTMKTGGTVTGKVATPAGYSPTQVEVVAVSLSGKEVGNTWVLADGTYEIVGLPALTYKLKFKPMTDGLAYAWSGGSTTFAGAESYKVTSGGKKVATKVTLKKSAKISGTVKSTASPDPLYATKLTVYRLENGKWKSVATKKVWGKYSVGSLPAGTYRVGFEKLSAGDWSLRGKAYPYCAQYWKGKGTLSSATSISLKAGTTKTKVSPTLRDCSKGAVKAGSLSISGVRRVGSTLTAGKKSWTPTGAKYTYQWLRDGKAVSKATKNTYKLTSSDEGKRISVRVTGTKTGYAPATKVSGKTLKVMKAPKPKITGTKKVGAKLTARRGTWTKGVRVSYQWYANGSRIKGATKSTYTLKNAQRTKRISVKTTGTRSGYAKVTVTSAKTEKVR